MKLDTDAYISVVENENDEAVEIPAEEDGMLLLANVSAQFPNASGLRYRTESNSLRAVRLLDGKLQPPEGGWGSNVYICSFPKEAPEDKKRKAEDEVGANKVLRTEVKCTDLILLGLSWKITEEQLREYFSEFGEIDMLQIKKDSKGQGRGFAFIRFTDIQTQLKVLSQRHTIEGRLCDAKIPNSKQISATVAAKIFVGRISQEMTEDVLREYFETFGEVQDIFISKPFRGFAFVTFKEANVAQSICGGDHVINDVHVQVRNAAPRVDYAAQRLQSLRNNGSGGGGGGRGMDYGNGRGNGGGSGGYGNGNSGGGGWSSHSGSMQQSAPPAMGQLNPMAVAAALNQAGLGSLLNSNYQSVGAPPPVPPPPSVNQAPPPSAGYGHWSSGASSGGGASSMHRPPPGASSSSHSSYHKSSAWS